MTENRVAELYCHGFIDKEVAEKLDKPIWTIRTHKKHIYNKLGISSEQELVLYMVAKYIGESFDVHLLRKSGLDAIFKNKQRNGENQSRYHGSEIPTDIDAG